MQIKIYTRLSDGTEYAFQLIIDQFVTVKINQQLIKHIEGPI